MQVKKTGEIRNIAFISHGSAGKTSLVEALLYSSGSSERLGEVDNGTSHSDFTPEEKERKMSIQTSFLSCNWRNKKINLIDTPGFGDFFGEVVAGVNIADSAVVVVSATDGVQVNTSRVWRLADKINLPRVIFINKLDKENSDFYRTLEDIQNNFGLSAVPLTLPVGKEDNFKGVVDLLKDKAFLYDGEKSQETDVPAELKDRVAELKQQLVEGLVETNEELMMKYLEDEQIEFKELAEALRKGIVRGEIYPVFAGSALKNIGIDKLLDYFVDTLPSPDQKGEITGEDPETGEEKAFEVSVEAPFSALVAKTMVDPYVGKLSIFKVYSGELTAENEVINARTMRKEKISKIYVLNGKEQENVDKVVAGDIAAVAKLEDTETNDTLCSPDEPIKLPEIEFPKPMLSLAAAPKREGDDEKISSALNRYAAEDPTFKVSHNSETKELIISGMGQLHLDVVKEVSKRKFGVEFETTIPKVAYRETIQKKVEVEEKYKKQSGGRGQYGHVLMRFEPLPRGKGFEFDEEIFGGAIPNQYIPAVEKGVQEAMAEGVLARYPVVDFKAVVYDGSYHSVDSSEMAFKIAASKAFKKAMEQADPVLLEPIMEVEVIVPEKFMGDIMGDLNSKRGKILGMEPRGEFQVIKAQVPLAEMFTYATDLKSITGGQGTFTMELAYYDKVPPRLSEKIIEERRQELEEDS